MVKMKKIITMMLLSICVLTGALFIFNIRQAKDVHAEAITEKDTFTYDGTNASAYNGESVFVITDRANAGLANVHQYYDIADDLRLIGSKLDSVKTVIVDDTATKIYYCMLKYFQKATKLRIGKMVNSIDMNDGEDFLSDYNMLALSTIEVDKDNTCFIVKDSVLYSADMTTLVFYPSEKKDTTFSIPDTVLNFSKNYMLMNSYLKKLNFGKSFGPLKAPYDKHNDVILPMNMGMSGLQEFTVDKENKYLSAVDGVLYDREKTETIAWPRKLVMKNVTFPSTLKTTAFDLISNTDKVKSITLSKNMEYLWVFDFTSRLHNFKNLEKISVPSDNKYFTVWKGGLYNKTLTLFYGFPQKSPLTTLEFAKGTTSLEIWTNVYPNIEKVILHSTFTEFYTHEGGGFRNFYKMFPKLKNIKISSNCKNYKSVNGVAFNKNETELIAYPVRKEGSSYVIPDSVISMNENMFAGCTKLKTLTIGKNLQAGQSFYMLMKYSGINTFKTVKNCMNYTTMDGILYNKNMTKLAAYPPYKKATTYEVPDSVTDITWLSDAVEIKELVLGKNVKDLYGFSFTNLKKLKSISVSKSNPYYMSKDGVLYNKAGTEVIYDPKKNS